MKFHVSVVAVIVALALSAGSWAADLFTDDFDVDHTANWTVNLSGVLDSDEAADFFFDYSTAGIPPAPNSTGGTTIGMNLQANRDSNLDGISAFSGFSVSPAGQDFSAAGDYTVTFDMWQNFPGPFPDGSNGTTQLSTFGIGTTGTFSNWPGRADGLYFAATLDGNSGSDYRAYAPERPTSYQFPVDMDNNVDLMADVDGLGDPIDSHATYHAYSRNNNTTPAGNFKFDPAPATQIVNAADYTLWRDNLGETDTNPIPIAPLKSHGNANGDLVVDQEDYELWKATYGDTLGLYAENFGGLTAPAAQLALYPQQTGMTTAGSLGMEWHEVEIAKVGNVVTWKVDDLLLMTIDTTNSVTPALTGGNIMFGQSDTNAGASTDPLRLELLFTLIDNIKVTTIPPGSGAAAAVPEPSTLVLVVLGLAAWASRRRGR